MKLNEKKKEIDKKSHNRNDRRAFLKKSIYSVPTLIAMGGLMKPTKASTFNGPPSDPDYNAIQFPPIR